MPRPYIGRPTCDYTPSLHVSEVRAKHWPNSVILTFTREGDSWTERVRLAYTRMHFGGLRAWLLCPFCNSRRTDLYHGRSGLACRKCYGLRYWTENEDQVGRLEMKERKILAKLGASWGEHYEDIEKPKGMRWKTFNRLMDQLYGAGTESDAATLDRFLAIIARS